MEDYMDFFVLGGIFVAGFERGWEWRWCSRKEVSMLATEWIGSIWLTSPHGRLCTVAGLGADTKGCFSIGRKLREGQQLINFPTSTGMYTSPRFAHLENVIYSCFVDKDHYPGISMQVRVDVMISRLIRSRPSIMLGTSLLLLTVGASA